MSLSYYIFLSNEGYTYQSNSESILPDIENMQVIGINAGVNAEDAFKKLLKENIFIKDTNFKNVFCYKLDNNYQNSREDFVISDFTRM